MLSLTNNNMEAMNLLIAKGANINLRKDSCCSILHEAINKDKLKLAETLLKKGADLKIKWNDFGQTPLYYAVQNNKYKMVKLIFKYDKNVDKKAKFGWTSLLQCAWHGNKEIAELLIDNGADINIRHWKNTTPLMIAINKKQFDVAKLLIAKGADITLKNKKGQAALDLAKKRKNKDIIKLLEEK